MMALTAEDHEVVRLIANEVASAVGKEMAAAQRAVTKELIEQHAAACPVKLTLYGSKRLLVGIGMGMAASAGGGGVLGAMIGKLLM